MTLFLWVAAGIFILFIFLEWGMEYSSTRRLTPQERGIIGKVNGIPIPYQNYSNLIEHYRKQGLELWKCKELAFNTLIEEALLQSVLESRKIILTDQEVVELIKNNPPPALLQDTMLQTNGSFDLNKYHTILSNPANIKWLESYEAFIRSEVPRQLLYQTITSAVRPTTVDLMSAYMQENTTLELEYVVIDSTLFDITEELLLEYYNTHKDEFLIPEAAIIKYVTFKADPTTDDEIDAKETAKELFALAKAGKSLDSLAIEYGYPIIERASSEIEFTPTKIGSLTGPVKKADGYHIMKGDTDLYIPVRPSDETLIRAEEAATNFISVARSESFEEAAKSYGLEIHKVRVTNLKSLPLQGVDLSYINLKTKNKLIGPVEGANCFYVLYTLGMRKSYIPEFNEIRAQVNNKYWRYKAQELAQQWIQQINEAPEPGSAFREILSAKGMEIKIVRLGNREIGGSETGMDSLRAQELFLKALNISENGVAVVCTDKEVCLVHCLKRHEPLKEEIEKSLPEFTGKWMKEEADRVYTEWLNNLKQKAEIKDYRYKVVSGK